MCQELRKFPCNRKQKLEAGKEDLVNQHVGTKPVAKEDVPWLNEVTVD